MSEQSPALTIQSSGGGNDDGTPPDPAIAVGSESVVTITNGSIKWYDLDGNLQGNEPIYSFLPDAYGDSRVYYDSVNDRFVVTSLGYTAGVGVGATMPIAVSKDGNPSDGWFYGSITATGATSLDYPSLTTDGSAIYIQVNANDGSNLLVIPNGLGTGGLYDGGAAQASVYTAAQETADLGEPVAMLSQPTGSPLTYLYNGTAFSPSADFFGTVYFEEVDTPTTNPTFVQRAVDFTGFPGTFASFPYPTQPGTSQIITTEFGRNAVYRDGYLYGVQLYDPVTGPNVGVATVHWFKIDTTNWTIADQGDVSGSALGAGVATFDATIAVDASGDFAINFTASGPDLYAGSYYALHRAGDPAGFLEAPQALHVGLATYDVTSETGGRNRWGDYERTIAAGPGNASNFWMFNQYASTPLPAGTSQYASEIGMFSVPCYVGGVSLLTTHGEVTVDNLRVGDILPVLLGDRVLPIVWIGHRHVDCIRHRNRAEVWPIRVRANSFANGMPHCDLLLSPDHAVFIDGVLIPIRHLINGRTIVQEQVDKVTYYHVELEQHDVILAEGLPCESYLDTGNRSAFANGRDAAMLHPDFALKVWETQACAELVVNGPKLAAAKYVVLAQAEALGHTRTSDPDISVVVDGRTLSPRITGNTWRVNLPRAARSVRLISRTWVPAYVLAVNDDTRSLGVAIANVRLDGKAIRLNDPLLSSGWLEPETGWRWTDGDAGLALAGVRELVFDVVMTGTYWEAAEESSVRGHRRHGAATDVGRYGTSMGA